MEKSDHSKRHILLLISFNEREATAETIIKTVKSEFKNEIDEGRLHIAYRGFKEKKLELPKGLSAKVSTVLPQGDFVVVGFDPDSSEDAKVLEIIERKSGNDFLCGGYEHFASQSHHLKELSKSGASCMVMLTKKPISTRSHEITESEIKRAITHQLDMTENGIRFINTFDGIDSSQSGEPCAAYAMTRILNYHLNGMYQSNQSNRAKLGIDPALLASHGKTKVEEPSQVAFVMMNCITGIGASTAHLLSKRYDTPEKVVKAFSVEDDDEIEVLKGMGLKPNSLAKLYRAIGGLTFGGGKGKNKSFQSARKLVDDTETPKKTGNGINKKKK